VTGGVPDSADDGGVPGRGYGSTADALSTVADETLLGT
jgi:hypothetical protein